MKRFEECSAYVQYILKHEDRKAIHKVIVATDDFEDLTPEQKEILKPVDAIVKQTYEHGEYQIIMERIRRKLRQIRV